MLREIRVFHSGFRSRKLSRKRNMCVNMLERVSDVMEFFSLDVRTFSKKVFFTNCS